MLSKTAKYRRDKGALARSVWFYSYVELLVFTYD